MSESPDGGLTNLGRDSDVGEAEVTRSDSEYLCTLIIMSFHGDCF
jgi:hypothetical protein